MGAGRRLFLFWGGDRDGQGAERSENGATDQPEGPPIARGTGRGVFAGSVLQTISALRKNNGISDTEGGGDVTTGEAGGGKAGLDEHVREFGVLVCRGGAEDPPAAKEWGEGGAGDADPEERPQWDDLMPHVSKKHPRYMSLKIREDLVWGFRAGLVVEAGLIAHGRGEALDYLLGEKSQEFAKEAEKAAVAALLTAEHPMISVNGNTAALVAPEIVQLAKLVRAKLEVNIFHRTVEREERIRDMLITSGANPTDVVGVGEAADTELPGIASARRLVAQEGIARADCLLVPLEDGDRTEALRRLNKTVIAIDLNPLSRTAQKASITIVDNVVRAIPKMIALGKEVATGEPAQRKQLVNAYDNQKVLRAAISTITTRLSALTDLDVSFEKGGVKAEGKLL
ncbi:MAG: phosphopantothenate/pantothenate synthetase [Candidatus Heimdallarchaeota archaeon]